MEQLLDEILGGLLLYARSWSRDDAEDLVQEAFLRLLKEPTPPKNPKGWLYRVVRNGAIDRLRRRRRSEQHRQDVATTWFIPPCNHSLDDAAELTVALTVLPESMREVVVARIWGELTLDEVATLTGSSKSSVHRTYQEALKRLKEILETRNASD